MSICNGITPFGFRPGKPYCLLLVVLLACLPGVYTAAQEVVPLTLDELVRAALQKDYAVKNQMIQIRQDEVRLRQAQETFVPRLSIEGAYAYTAGNLIVDFQEVTTPILNLPLFEGQTKEGYRSNFVDLSATLEVVLFTGLKVDKLSKALDYKILAEKDLLEKTRNDRIMEVVKYYDELAVLQESGELLNRSRELLNRERERADRALQTGLITPFDHKRIELATLELEAKQTEFEGSRRLLFSKLEQLTGYSRGQLEQLQVELLPFDIAEIDTTISRRSELRALENYREASDYKMKSTVSGYLPRVAAFAAGNYLSFFGGRVGDLGLNQLSVAPNGLVGVGMQWDVFDGLTSKREKELAQLEKEMIDNRYEEASELLRLNMDNARLQFDVANAQLQLARRRMELSNEALQNAGKELEAGLLRKGEYLEAITQYHESVLEYQEALLEQRQAALGLMGASGNLSTEFFRN